MPLWLDCVDLPKIFINEDWFIPRTIHTVKCLFSGRTEIIAKIMHAISNDCCMTKRYQFILTGVGGVQEQNLFDDVLTHTPSLPF